MSNKAVPREKGRVVVISGPSGCGKTTLHKELLDNPLLKGRLVKSISATTRHKRPGERDGRDYLFITPKIFEKRIKEGYFLEWQKVFDHFYGTPKKTVASLLKKGTHVLLCIDVKGARSVVSEFPDSLKIFIKAPSLRVLEERLKARGSESRESLALRLRVARQEIKEAGRYDYVVVNGDLRKAIKILEEIVCRELGIYRPTL